MTQHLVYVTLIVRAYDEAISWFTQVLGFALREDTDLGGGKRWVVVAPPGARETSLLLAQASSDAQRAAVGMQCAGRVGFFLHTDDFARDHAKLQARGVSFVEPPRHEPYGTVAVFEDLYRNRWDLIQLTSVAGNG
jgi:catechol 2,3-dioxygenase-like lactoylglutathione lyase family enzyme